VIGNKKKASHYGFELAMNVDVTDNWRLYSGYSFLATVGDTEMDAGDPKNQLYVQSAWEFAKDWELDLIWRYVDNFAMADTTGSYTVLSSYNAVDVRVAWQARPGLELALVGRNLLDPTHFEFPSGIFLGNVHTEVQSEVYGMITWRH
jgi:iron complex outermembrane receptor protein